MDASRGAQGPDRSGGGGASCQPSADRLRRSRRAPSVTSVRSVLQFFLLAEHVVQPFLNTASRLLPFGSITSAVNYPSSDCGRGPGGPLSFAPSARAVEWKARTAS